MLLLFEAGYSDNEDFHKIEVLTEIGDYMYRNYKRSHQWEEKDEVLSCEWRDRERVRW